MLTVYTIGHFTRTAGEFVGLRDDYGITQFGRKRRPEILQAKDIRYADLTCPPPPDER